MKSLWVKCASYYLKLNKNSIVLQGLTMPINYPREHYSIEKNTSVTFLMILCFLLCCYSNSQFYNGWSCIMICDLKMRLPQWLNGWHICCELLIKWRHYGLVCIGPIILFLFFKPCLVLFLWTRHSNIRLIGNIPNKLLSLTKKKKLLRKWKRSK